MNNIIHKIRHKHFKFILLFLLLLLIGTTLTVNAHSGRTDSKGGHYNRSTGEYHYHHGESAHQHPNGVCPYQKTTVLSEENSSASFLAEHPGVLIMLVVIIIFVTVVLTIIVKDKIDRSKTQKDDMK